MSKRFLRCLGTYKCQSELGGDEKLNKITWKTTTTAIKTTLLAASVLMVLAPKGTFAKQSAYIDYVDKDMN